MQTCVYVRAPYLSPTSRYGTENVEENCALHSSLCILQMWMAGADLCMWNSFHNNVPDLVRLAYWDFLKRRMNRIDKRNWTVNKRNSVRYKRNGTLNRKRTTKAVYKKWFPSKCALHHMGEVHRINSQPDNRKHKPWISKFKTNEIYGKIDTCPRTAKNFIHGAYTTWSYVIRHTCSEFITY